MVILGFQQDATAPNMKKKKSIGRFHGTREHTPCPYTCIQLSNACDYRLNLREIIEKKTSILTDMYVATSSATETWT
jgi:hypothetical protein